MTEPTSSSDSVPMLEGAETVNVNNPSSTFSPTSTQTMPCTVCKSATSLYKCPGCSITTCSCECVKQHKIQSGCNGKRNRAEFVSKSGFNDQNLRSDYHFLEDTLQLRTSAQRTAGKSFGGGLNSKTVIRSAAEGAHTMEEVMQSQLQQQQSHKGSGGGQISQSASKLVKGAKEHGVELALMPSGMTKRKHNTSRYHKKEEKIYWKLQINFILCADFTLSSTLSFELSGLDRGGGVLGLCSEARREVDEDTLLGDVITNYLETTSANLSNRHHLRGLRANGLSLHCYMQHIPSPSVNPLFVELSLDSTLRSCLAGKKIIEYPTFVVGVQSHTSCLRLMIRELDTSLSSVSSVAVDVVDSDALISPAGTGADDFLSPNKRRQLEELSSSAKKIRLDGKSSGSCGSSSGQVESSNVEEGDGNGGGNGDGERMDEEEGGDEEEFVDESFIEQLVDIENADISTLQNLIQNLEERQQ